MKALKIKGEGAFWWFVLATTTLYFIVAILPEICRMPVGGAMDAAILTAYYLLIFLMQGAVILLLSLNKYVFASLFPILFTVTTVLAYFFITINVTLSVAVVDLCLNNDLSTSADFVTWPVVLTALAGAATGIAAAWLRFRITAPKRPWIWIAAGGSLVLIVACYNVPRVKAMIIERQPFIIESSVSQYLSLQKDKNVKRDTFDNVEASAPADSLTVVFVIGESLRSDHLGINGYERETTPMLSQEPNLVSFPNITTTAFYTMLSMPRLLTRSDDNNLEKHDDEQSFLPLFRKAGFHTSWIANQEPLPTFGYILEEADTTSYVCAGHSLYMYDKWLDEELLPDFGKALSRPQSRKLIVLHSIGSHWWFPTHYTEKFARFKPEVSSRNLSRTTHEEVVNSYDNTVLYTDWFLGSVISRLRDKNAILLFLSDHGEGLGEDGCYLHAAPNQGTEKVAAFVYWTDKYAASHPDKVEAFKRNRMKGENTGYLFHTILDCAGISTPVLEHDRSLAR